MPDSPLDVKSFAAKIKEKYPDYAEMDDYQLARKIVEKYPDYQSVVGEPNQVALSDPRVKDFLDRVSKAEGADYNTLVGGQKINDLSRHPNKVGLRTAAGPSTAFGRYQITGTTNRTKLKKYSSLDYSPPNQDLRAVELLSQTGALDALQSNDYDTAVKLAGKEWASLPGSTLPGHKRPDVFANRPPSRPTEPQKFITQPEQPLPSDRPMTSAAAEPLATDAPSTQIGSMLQGVMQKLSQESQQAAKRKQIAQKVAQARQVMKPSVTSTIKDYEPEKVEPLKFQAANPKDELNWVARTATDAAANARMQGMELPKGYSGEVGQRLTAKFDHQPTPEEVDNALMENLGKGYGEIAKRFRTEMGVPLTANSVAVEKQPDGSYLAHARPSQGFVDAVNAYAQGGRKAYENALGAQQIGNAVLARDVQQELKKGEGVKQDLGQAAAREIGRNAQFVQNLGDLVQGKEPSEDPQARAISEAERSIPRQKTWTGAIAETPLSALGAINRAEAMGGAPMFPAAAATENAQAGPEAAYRAGIMTLPMLAAGPIARSIGAEEMSPLARQVAHRSIQGAGMAAPTIASGGSPQEIGRSLLEGALFPVGKKPREGVNEKVETQPNVEGADQNVARSQAISGTSESRSGDAMGIVERGGGSDIGRVESEQPRHVDLQPRRVRGDGKGQFKKETKAQAEERRAQVAKYPELPQIENAPDYVKESLDRVSTSPPAQKPALPSTASPVEPATKPSVEPPLEAATTPQAQLRPPASEVKQPWEMTREELTNALINRSAESFESQPLKLGGEDVVQIGGYHPRYEDLMLGTEQSAGQGNRRLSELHRGEVEQALREGKPVPAEVLKDYPDLQPIKAETTATRPTTILRVPDGARIEQVDVPFTSKNGETKTLTHYQIIGPDGKPLRGGEYESLEKAKDGLRDISTQEPEAATVPGEGVRQPPSTASPPKNLPELQQYGREVVGDNQGIKEVRLIGSTAAKGTGRDTDVLYDLGDIKLPKDEGDATEKIIEILEKHDHLDASLTYDTFVKAGDRYFYRATGAGPYFVENSEYGREQAGKPSIVLASATQAKGKPTVEAPKPEESFTVQSKRVAQQAVDRAVALEFEAEKPLAQSKYAIPDPKRPGKLRLDFDAIDAERKAIADLHAESDRLQKLANPPTTEPQKPVEPEKISGKTRVAEPTTPTTESPLTPQESIAGKPRKGGNELSVDFESASGDRRRITVKSVKYADLPPEAQKMVEDTENFARSGQDWKEAEFWSQVRQGKKPVTFTENVLGDQPPSYQLSRDKPADEFERWASRDLYDAKFNPAAEEVRQSAQAKRAAKEQKAEQDRVAAESAQAEARARQQAYDAKVEAVKLPTGKRTKITLAKAKGEELPAREVDATVYGDWAIHKEEGRYVENPYTVTHVPTGMKAGELPSLAEAKRLIKGFMDSDAKTATRDLVSDKESLATLAKVHKYIVGGGEPPSAKPEPTIISKAKTRLAEREALKKKGVEYRGSGGPDTQVIIDHLIVHGYDVYQKGKVKFEDWADEMRSRFQDFKDEIEPHLREIYQRIAGSGKTATETETLKERSLPKTRQESGREAGDELFYEPISDVKATDAAQKRIDRNPDEAEIWVKTAEPSAERTETLRLLSDKLQTEAVKSKDRAKAEELMSRANDLASLEAIRATTLGQTIQKFSINNKFTPSGALQEAYRLTGEKGLEKDVATHVTETAVKYADANKEIEKLRERVAELESQAIPKPKTKTRKTDDWLARLTAREAEVRARLEARKSIKLGPESGAAPIIPDIEDLAVLGAIKMAKKGINLAQWSADMVSDLGEQIKPHLEDIRLAAARLIREEKARDRELHLRDRIRGDENISDEVLDQLVAEHQLQQKMSRKGRAQLLSVKENALLQRVGTLSDDPKVVAGAVKLTRPETNRGEITREMRNEFGMTNAEVTSTLAKSNQLLKQARKELAKERKIQKLETQYPEATQKEIEDLYNQLDQHLKVRRDAKMELTRTFARLERGEHGVYGRVLNIQRSLMVSAFSTAIRNAQTQVGRFGIERLTDVVETALRQSVGLPRDLTYSGIWKDAKNVFNPKIKGKAERILEEFPTEHEQVFGTYSSDVEMPSKVQSLLGKGEQAAAMLNWANKLQEFHLRAAEFISKLDNELGKRGESVEEYLNKRKADQIPIEAIRAASKAALEVTFADAPAGNTAAGQLIRLSNKIPPTLSPIPFARYFYNSMKFLYQYNPTGFIDLARSGQNRPRVVAKALVGTSMLLAASMLRKSDYAGDKWYELRAPGTDKLIDMRPFGPFSIYLFLGDAINKIRAGKEIGLKDASDAFGAGTSRGTGWDVIDKTMQLLSSPDEAKRNRAWNFLKGEAGESTAAMLTPIRQLKDVIAQFDKSQAVRKDTASEPFLGPIKESIPYASKNLPPLRLPTSKEPVHQEQPLLKTLTGYRVESPKTPVEKELQKLGMTFKGAEKTGDETLDTQIREKVAVRVSSLSVPEGTELGKKKILEDSLGDAKTLAQAEVARENPDKWKQYLSDKKSSSQFAWLRENRAKLTDKDVERYQKEYANAYVDRLRNIPEWEKKTDEQKLQILSRLERIAHTLARAKLSTSLKSTQPSVQP